MGLGSIREKGLFLSIAGGYIWNRKADETDPDYGTQEFTRADKTTGVRTGAMYADLTGKIVGVKFKTHPEYGENINVTIDSEGERFIVSISTNNRYSQDMMKFLLNGNLEEEVFMKPYDFIDEKKKRAQGISFRQNGEKVDLRVKDAPTKEKGWFEEASKKDIKRFFEDLSEWFVAEVEERVCSQFEDTPPPIEKEESAQEYPEEKGEVGSKEEPQTEVKKEDIPQITPLKMKKFLKEYIEENYKGKELPKLSKEEVVRWYNLAQNLEELPFEEQTDTTETSNDGAVDQAELDRQLNSLLPKK